MCNLYWPEAISIESGMSGLLSGAKGRTVSLNRSGTPKGEGEKVKFHPSLRPIRGRGRFSTPTVKCCRLPLSTSGGNKEITSFRGSVLQGPIGAPECPSQVLEGTFRAREGLFKNNVGKKRVVSFFGRGPFDQATFHGSLHPHRQRFGAPLL